MNTDQDPPTAADRAARPAKAAAADAVCQTARAALNAF